MTQKIALEVNGIPIALDHFVQVFVEHTLTGMLGSLKNTGPVTNLSLSIEGDKVNIILNGKAVKTNQFASKIVKSTVFGMAMPLKGVNEINSVKIEIAK